MFRAHVLIVRRAKLYYTVSGIITPIGIIKFSALSWLILINKYIEMNGQQNIKTYKFVTGPTLIASPRRVIYSVNIINLLIFISKQNAQLINLYNSVGSRQSVSQRIKLYYHLENQRH